MSILFKIILRANQIRFPAWGGKNSTLHNVAACGARRLRLACGFDALAQNRGVHFLCKADNVIKYHSALLRFDVIHDAFVDFYNVGGQF